MASACDAPLSGRVIVCIASAWNYDPTSKHHLMKLLAGNNQIIWVNYHGTRRPTLKAADMRSAAWALKRFCGGIRRVGPNMVQLTPLVLPGATTPPLTSLSRAMLVGQIRRAVRIVDPLRDRPLQVWSFAPDVGELVGAFDEECFVYYCVDEFAKFEGVDARRIADSECILLDQADVVITTSESLHASRLARRPDAVLIRHGVEYGHFAQCWRRPPAMPLDLNGVPRPIFGFFGLIQHWMDLELIERVARLRPRYSFFLIGEVQSDTTALRQLPNVFLPGRRPFADLPAYCAHFDAGLLLFKRTEMTRNVNPIKLFEYLAAGLPVISTTIPEVARVPGPIRLADTPESYAACCDAVIENRAFHSRERTSRLVADETWESRLAALAQIIGRKLGDPQRRPADRLEKPPHVEVPRAVRIGAVDVRAMPTAPLSPSESEARISACWP